MSELEQKNLIAICILAAFADGTQSEAERHQVQTIAEGFHQNPILATVYQEVLDHRLTLSAAAQGLQDPQTRALAYEMAVCVCNADGIASEGEKKFLEELRLELRLDSQVSERVAEHAELLMQPPPIAVPPKLSGAASTNVDQLILDHALLAGALELLPHSLATMAIIPIQLRLVYRIGQQHGVELSRGHIQEFLATVGIGLTSQVVEGFASKLLSGVTRSLGGRLLGGLAGVATGSAFAFGTTYALGRVAEQYYASGRTLSPTQLREVFRSMLSEGNSLQQRYTSQIAEKSRQINVADLIPLVRQS